MQSPWPTWMRVSFLAFNVVHRKITKTISAPGVHGVIAVPKISRVYASATNARDVLTINSRTGTVLARAPAGEYPAGLAYDPVQRHVFISVTATPLVAERARRRVPRAGAGGQRLADLRCPEIVGGRAVRRRGARRRRACCGRDRAGDDGKRREQHDERVRRAAAAAALTGCRRSISPLGIGNRYVDRSVCGSTTFVTRSMSGFREGCAGSDLR